jgi:hypothetical protein
MKLRTYFILLFLIPLPRELYGWLRFVLQQHRVQFTTTTLSFQLFQIFLGRLSPDEKSYRRLISNRLAVRDLFSFDSLGLSTPKILWNGRYLSATAWNLLPSCFILKNAVASGNNLFVDKNHNKRFLVNLWLLFSMPIPYGFITKEWYYSLRTVYIAEEILASSTTRALVDFKFFCSNSVPFLLQVDIDRNIDHKRNLYRIDSSSNYTLLDCSLHSYCSEKDFVLPPSIFIAYRASCVLSRYMTLCRVDFYIQDGIVTFGEITNVPGSGFERFSNSIVDYELGLIATSLRS